MNARNHETSRGSAHRACLDAAERIDALTWAYTNLLTAHPAQLVRLPLLAGMFMELIARETGTLSEIADEIADHSQDAAMLDVALERLIRTNALVKRMKWIALEAMTKAGVANPKVKLNSVTVETNEAPIIAGAVEALKEKLATAI